MDDPDVGTLLPAYVASVVDLALPGRGWVTLGPRPRSTTAGRFPSGSSHLHVITAANPRSRPLPPAENVRRTTALARELHALGLTTLPAVGRSEDRSWREPCLVVTDADEPTVLALALRADQHAVYRWTATHRAVVWTDPRRPPHLHGWWLAPVTSPQPPSTGA